MRIIKIFLYKFLKEKNAMKKFLTYFLALVLVFAMVLPLASCKNDAGKENESNTGNSELTDTQPERVLEKFEGDFVYKDAVVKLSSSWNPHTWQTEDQGYPRTFIVSGLYDFRFNDALNPVEGKDPYTGYVIVPEMAAAMPVDITKDIKALEGNPYGIPESATSGYAYKIALNRDAKWQDGTPITAATYVYSMKALFEPKMNNYRTSDYMDGDFSIANVRNYFYQGQTMYMDNGTTNGYVLADLVKGADGNYATKNGNPMYVGVDFALAWTGGNTLAQYVGAYGDAYFGMEKWEELLAMADENGLVPLNDTTNALLASVTTTNPNWGESDADLFNYYVEKVVYEDNYDFSKVGCFASDEYELTLVFSKSLAGFNLLYNLSSNWLVYEDLYESCKKQVAGTDAWETTYNTSVETTMSYGPYKMVSYEKDKSMRFERNENWWGYTDGKHVYVDPENDKLYPMYQTTAIDCQVVSEAATRKLMFLKGQLMGYGLQSEDFASYRNSKYAHVTPSETIFFFIFNGYLEAIQQRENNADFDKTKNDLETLTLESFRRAIAVTYDKEAFASTISPSRSGGYGLIGSAYLYDPETGARYRDTDQAKKALCDFYSVDVNAFGGDLDKAVDSITGYDPETAKKLYTDAFNEALEKGYITSADGKHSDQTIRIQYASSEHSDFIQKTLDYLNEKLAAVLVGTPFEGKIEFYESAPLGDPGWSDSIKAGMSDTVLGGWSGSPLNPFSLTDLYTNPARQYDAKWFDSAKVNLTLKVKVDGAEKEITTNIKNWSDALNGTTIKVGDAEYNFGDGVADVNTRLDILAALEATILQTYDYIPMLQDGSVALLSQQVYYVVEEYNPVMGRGGIAYMKYNYNETEWKTYCSNQPNGELAY